MAIDKCLTEVKRVVKDLLTDDEINEVLTKVKSNLAIARAAKEVDINDAKIAQKVIDEIELEQAQNKRNLANDTIKSIEEANNIIENFAKNPVKGIRALLVGIEDFGVGSRRSVGNEQTALEEVYMRNFFTDLEKADVVDVFSDGKMDLEVYRELSGVDTGVKQAKALADVIKKHNEILRTQLNNLGANIGILDDWIIRMFHDADKMIGAAGRTETDWRVHQRAWREYIKTELDMERTFPEAKNVDEILDEIYTKLRSGVFFKSEGLDNIYGSSSLAKKLSHNRVLHFKDADARFRYDQKFGSGKLRESMVHGIQLASRNIAMMNRLGTKPKANFERILRILQVHYAKVNPKIARDLKVSKFNKEFSEVDGSVYSIENEIGAKVGMAVRFFQGTGKLGFATISSFADLATYMTETNYQGRGLFTGLTEALGQLTGLSRNKQALDVLSVVSNSTIGTMNQKMSMRGDMTGKFASLSSLFYRMNALNYWVSNLKSAMTVGVARMYGMKKGVSFDKLANRERNLLTLYRIDAGKWDMLRSVSSLEADGKTYMTAEKIDEISNESINSYLGRKISKREADNFKMDLQLSYRNLLIDRAMHGTPEPDAAVRATLNRGWKRGTWEGELMRLFTQFKSFPTSIWMKVIGRELKGYGPGENKLRAGAFGIANTIIFGTMMGYLAMTAKDALRGKSPRDMKDHKNWLAAFVQGGGLGIYGDFFYSELKNGYGGSLQETIMGPAVGDFAKFLGSLGDLSTGNPKKFAKKNYEILEGNTPFLNLFYTKAIYDYLIGYQVKEMLDPGFFRRMRRKTYKNQGSKYFLTP
tara:strand:+ start:3404 stop:5851 length:2448 start_codon:yes stop_codon:yes gene_type:complete